MSLLLDVVSIAMVGLGLVFIAGGTIGLVRFPDLYSRAHAASKCDAVGASAILVALALQAPTPVAGLKMGLLMVLVLVTAPTTAHALARSAYRTGRMPWRRHHRDAP